MDSSTPQKMTLPQAMELALTHHQAGRFPEAKGIYLQILSADPENFDALHLLGVLAHQVGNHDLAVELIEKAVHKNSGNAAAFNNLGEAYRALNNLGEAERCYHQALAIKPDFAEAYSNLGNALKDLGRLENAEQAFRQALAVRPQFAEVQSSLGCLLKDLGRAEEAEKALRQTLSLRPDSADAAFNLSQLLLMQGNFEEGLKLFERRFESSSESILERVRGYLKQLHEQRRWQGEALDGLRLLVLCERGAGDTLMMMRYLPMLKEQNAAQLVLYCTPHLTRVLQTLDCIDEVIPMTQPLPFGRFDLYCPMMSLPFLFHTTAETIPDSNPYLRVPQEHQSYWRSRLEGMEGIKVGLAFATGRLIGTYRKRSIELSLFAPLREIEGVRLVTLQKGAEAEQLKKLGWDIPDFITECKDFLDTAALVDQLDLVITVDTSVAHLAGALGKPVWLLNPADSEWRWMLDREDSPWYPGMKIYRQREQGEWDGVIEQVAEDLSAFMKSWLLLTKL